MLSCSKCHTTLHHPLVIKAFETKQYTSIQVCAHCLSLNPPSKPIGIKRFLKYGLKHPKYLSAIVKKHHTCKNCHGQQWFEWNGLCPKCGSHL